MQKPKPNLEKVAELWNTWEKGEANPGQLLSQLKINGLPEILKELVEQKELAEQDENNNTTGD
tara:strand:+ start:494 stop:682 length:189 start_codon:yes stop_codon:yes gene_type:complete